LEERTALIKFLGKHGVSAVFHYIPLHGAPASKLYGRVFGSMEVTQRISDCLLRLPLYYGMEKEDVRYVIQKVTDFYLD
jgi:dTDP-4-amino-4,6-dideoxygalactose transaminase